MTRNSRKKYTRYYSYYYYTPFVRLHNIYAYVHRDTCTRCRRAESHCVSVKRVKQQRAAAAAAARTRRYQVTARSWLSYETLCPCRTRTRIPGYRYRNYSCRREVFFATHEASDAADIVSAGFMGSG